MRKVNWTRIELAALALVLLVVLIGSLIKPDKVVEKAPYQATMIPFITPTPTPASFPVLEGGDQSGFNQGGVNGENQADSQNPDGQLPLPAVITHPPNQASPLLYIAASPPPQPARTNTPPTPAPTNRPPPTSTPTRVPTRAPTPTAKPTADGVLRKGSSGSAVRRLQQRLKDLRYYTGSVDGVFGTGTESALRDFQKRNGLTADGVAGQRTLAVINSSGAKAKPRNTPTPAKTPRPTAKPTPTKVSRATPRPTPNRYTPSTPGKYRTLQKGSGHTADVKKLQQRLKDLGYYKGAVNGVYDDATEAAVIAFQKRNGEWVDGVAGQDTQNRLFSSSALPSAANISDGVMGIT